jgi:23S rRNA (adenine2030-N6)-methyltransferase
MLSYRHAFHAGSAADVLKHSVLVFCLDYLTRKDKPLLCIDTHAGAGLYSLEEGFAAKNREWEKGIGALQDFAGSAGRQTAGPQFDAALPALYLKILNGAGPALCRTAPCYPGSPAIMSALLRKKDKAFCFELHPADFAALSDLLGRDTRFTVKREDGLASLRALLPPPSGRGLILIDPSYEVKDDYRTIPAFLAEALNRFPQGTYIIWYPVLLKEPARGRGLSFSRALGSAAKDTAGRTEIKKLRAELYTADRNAPPENSPRGMRGSGLMIFNPPWTLRAALEKALPVLAGAIGAGPDSWHLS